MQHGNAEPLPKEKVNCVFEIADQGAGLQRCATFAVAFQTSGISLHLDLQSCGLRINGCAIPTGPSVVICGVWAGMSSPGIWEFSMCFA